ncbi:MAG TPA: hypothetical protein VHE37_07000 [Nevskiaceae bacterium]|nr:hypothetical protein [Nevskiaceae bacterium]
MLPSPWPARLAPLLPFLVACLLYWPCTHFEFIWDDSSYIVGQGALADWTQAWHSAWSAYLQGSLIYFRPLPILTLALDILPDGAAAAAHRSNVLLHAANSALVAILSQQLAMHFGHGRRSAAAAALLAGILYAAHPALIQTAAWISCRFDLLLTLLALAFLLADRRLAGKPQRAPGLALLFLLAALCKESAVVLPLLLPWWRRLFAPAGTPLRQQISGADFSWLLASGCCYLALRAFALHEFDAVRLPWLEPAQQLLLVLKSIGGYAALALLPFGRLDPLHPLLLPVSPLDPEVLAGITTLVATAWALRSSRPLAALLPCWTLALLPVINLLRFNLADYEQERFLTLPLVFVCIGAAQLMLAAVARGGAMRGGSLAVVAGWLAAAVLAIASYLPAWRSNLDLWGYALTHHPASPVAQKFALISLNAAGRSADAAELGLQLDHHYSQLTPEVRFGYARSLLEVGQPAEALRQLDLIAQAHGAEEQWHDSVCAEGGWAALSAGFPAQAESMLRAVSQSRADLAEVRYQLGIALAVQGRGADAQREFERAEQAAPQAAHDWHARAPALIAHATSLAQEEHPPIAHPALDQLCRPLLTP